MTAPQAFRDLATVIEGFDAAEISVDGVGTNGDRSADEESLTAELTARIPWNASADLDGAVSFTLPDGTDVESSDGELTVPLRVELADDAGAEGDGDVRGAVTDERAGAAKTQVTDGGVRAPVKTDDAASLATDRSGDRATESQDETRSDSEEGAQTETTSATTETENGAPEFVDEGADGNAPADEPATPPHRDPERLREVYESRDTFAEMTEALGASVTPQTVRNQMIRRGIHEPNRQRGSSAGDEADATERGASEEESGSESNEETAEGGDSSDDRSAAVAARPQRSDDDSEGEEPTEVDLPSHVSLDDVGAAVAGATTLYEVQRALRTDRTTTRKLLQQLNLLELVTGRVATADDRKGTAEEIDERIRRVRA